MPSPLDRLSSERLHATCVAINGQAVLITGRPGAGKSDLALRLLDRGARLVADDATLVVRTGEGLRATAPDTIRGRMEVRGIGIVAVEALEAAPVVLLVELGQAGDRLPATDDCRAIAGVALPVVRLDGAEASAPIKVEWALRGLGIAR